MRLVADDGTQIGVISLQEALMHARNKGMDLVEVAPQAKPPVCKLMDYGKYLYQQKKKQKESRKRQHTIQVKEVVLRPAIDDHDFEVKRKQATKFIGEGNRVKVTVRFRGRELRRKDMGTEVIMRMKDALSEIAQMDGDIIESERHMVATFMPKRKKGGQDA